MDGLYLVQDSTLYLSAFVHASIYVTQNIIKMPKQLVKRKLVNLPVMRKQFFEWTGRKAAMAKVQSAGPNNNAPRVRSSPTTREIEYEDDHQTMIASILDLPMIISDSD